MPQRLSAIARQRCPVCMQGSMFRSTFAIHSQCPVCGHPFMRETGFFQGAMFVSYAIGVGTAAVLLLSARHWLGPHIGLVTASAVAVAMQLLLVVPMFRYSRVIWAHLNVATRQSTGEGSVGR